MKKRSQKPARKTNIIRSSIALLSAGDATVAAIPSKTLEDVLSWYMKLLLLSGVVAGVFSFVRSLGWAYYLHIIRGVTIDVGRLMNYSFGIATGTFFVYLFAGTFGMFVVSFLLWVVFARTMRLAHVVMVCMYAMTPVYLLGWIDSTLALVLLVWSAFLVLTGFATLRRLQKA